MPKEWNTPGGTAPRLYLDILQQPHTLIAGTTGSGKSVLMNGVIFTALYKAPSQVQFVFIDTKYTEQRIYKDLPHTVQYIDNAAEAAQALESVLKETRNRAQRAAAQGLKQSTESHLYIFIDELGDLVLSNRATARTLGQIAMIGRAANVHLIGGTQCPNRKTLSAEFAANCAARVGLRCRDPIESRQIIGSPAAVRLPFVGYGYYLTPQLLTPELVKIPYITDSELAARVQWWTDQNKQSRRHWWSR